MFSLNFTSWSSKQNIFLRVIECVEDLSPDGVEVIELVQLLIHGIPLRAHLLWNKVILNCDHIMKKCFDWNQIISENQSM